MIKGVETGQVDLQKLRRYFEEVQPLMTLIESHASYVQGVLCQRYFPQAQIEHHSACPSCSFACWAMARGPIHRRPAAGSHGHATGQH